MQINYPKVVDILIIVWFALSVFIEVVSGIVLWFWLRRQGVKLNYLMVKMPGNMERAYREWCWQQGRRPNRGIIIFRAISLINVIAAAVVSAMFLAAR